MVSNFPHRTFLINSWQQVCHIGNSQNDRLPNLVTIVKNWLLNLLTLGNIMFHSLQVVEYKLPWVNRSK